MTLYLGSTSHRQYAGPDSLETMAATILESHGPSGPNIEYLYNLATSMRELVPEETDPHLDELETEVKKQCVNPVNGNVKSSYLLLVLS